MTEPNTHPSIDPRLCGEIVALADGVAQVELTTDARMSADARGLVHGGFIFGAADYAAMLAINDPNVVLGAASIKFLAPTKVGEQVRIKAERRGEQRRKCEVGVAAHVGATLVFEGTFTCFVLDHHVFDNNKQG